MASETTVPKGTGGAYHTAADGRPQADGRLYVDGDAPWFVPITFERDGKPTPNQGGQNLGPFHVPGDVVANATGDAWRVENVVDWAPGQTASGTGGGYTPQQPYSPGQSDLVARYFTLKQALLAFGQALGVE